MMNSIPVSLNKRAGDIQPCSLCDRFFINPPAYGDRVRAHKAEIRKIENDPVCPRCSADIRNAELLLSLNRESTNFSRMCGSNEANQAHKRKQLDKTCENATPQANFQFKAVKSVTSRRGKNKLSTSFKDVKGYAETEKQSKRCKIMHNPSIESVLIQKEEEEEEEERQLVKHLENTFVKLRITSD
ncbi:hypothetical protein ACFE04_030607 [Oxalis oulophora]